MSLPTRASLAMALAWAGGFAVPGPAGAALIVLAAALALGGWIAAPNHGDRSTPTRLAGTLALTLLLALLARTLGRVLIASPAALAAALIAGLALIVAGRFGERAATPRARALALAIFAAMIVGAATLGVAIEARGPQPRGAVFSGPVLGVHPRQAVAVRIDGFGPHDIIVDDYVDPPGGQGYDPQAWAAHLQAELRTIGERNYADGPARARAAFGGAVVEARESIATPADRELLASLLGVEVRSGTIGEGSTVEFLCPGQPRDPRGPSSRLVCPRKYLIDGSSGLGLSPRWPGYTEVRGRDRVRLARAFGWPSGDAKTDRRLLALESGAWGIGLVLLFVIGVGWAGTGWARRRAGEPSAGPERSPTLARWAVGGLALALVALLSVFLLAPASTAGALGSPRGGPTVLAILLLLLPTRREDKPAALPCALLLALLAAAPASGQGDALELLAISRDLLVDLGLGWALAGALAGSLAAVVLTLGVGICAASLIARPQPPGPSTTAGHTRALLLAVGLALALGVGLALRKPGDDLALLQGAAALLLLATTRARSRAGDHGLAIVCALAAAAPLLDAEARDSLATTLVGVGSLLCLAVGFARSRGSAPPRSNG